MVWTLGKDERLVKKVYKSEVRDRPKKRWKDGVKEALNHRGLDIQEGERRARDRVRWSDVVYGATRRQ